MKKTPLGKQRRLLAEKSISDFISTMYGSDSWKEDPSMKDTSKRFVKMFSQDFMAREFTERPKMSTFPNTKKLSDMVVLGNIAFTTMCEHHFLPVYGKAYIGYVPSDKVLGLSKFSRLVQWLAKKPSLQEMLTHEIGEALTKLVGEDVVIVLKAKHDCCNLRGVTDRDMETTTLFTKGVFEKDYKQYEKFLGLVNL